MSARVIAIGLGNVLMSDEGVGVHVVQAVRDAVPGDDSIVFLEAGTSGMCALHAMAGLAKAVFVDCAFMGTAPGTLRCFSPDDVASRTQCRRFSLHEGDLLEIIALSRRLEECPAVVRIFGIEPAQVAPGEHLSPVLAARMADYVRAVVAELATEK